MQVLHGRKALENFSKENRYLFHGSSKSDIETFVPRESESRGESEGKTIQYDDKVFFATEYLDVAIFAAVVFHLGRSGWYTHDEGDPVTFTFNADADVVEKARTTTGYVYLLPKDQFESSKTTAHEYVSTSEVTPLYCVEVTADDLKPPLDTLQPDPDSSH